MKRGRKRHPFYCALVLAFQRAVPEAHTVYIKRHGFRDACVVLSRWSPTHTWTREIQLPEIARRFCDGEWMKWPWADHQRPFEFEIDLYL